MPLTAVSSNTTHLPILLSWSIVWLQLQSTGSSIAYIVTQQNMLLDPPPLPYTVSPPTNAPHPTTTLTFHGGLQPNAVLARPQAALKTGIPYQVAAPILIGWTPPTHTTKCVSSCNTCPPQNEPVPTPRHTAKACWSLPIWVLPPSRQYCSVLLLPTTTTL